MGEESRPGARTRRGSRDEEDEGDGGRELDRGGKTVASAASERAENTSLSQDTDRYTCGREEKETDEDWRGLFSG